MSDSDSEEKQKQPNESDRKLTQNDLLATRRSDVVDGEDAEDDENAENGTVDWMRRRQGTRTFCLGPVRINPGMQLHSPLMTLFNHELKGVPHG